jgi:hypothetical protein
MYVMLLKSIYSPHPGIIEGKKLDQRSQRHETQLSSTGQAAWGMQEH